MLMPLRDFPPKRSLPRCRHLIAVVLHFSPLPSLAPCRPPKDSSALPSPFPPSLSVSVAPLHFFASVAVSLCAQSRLSVPSLSPPASHGVTSAAASTSTSPFCSASSFSSQSCIPSPSPSSFICCSPFPPSAPLPASSAAPPSSAATSAAVVAPSPCGPSPPLHSCCSRR